MDKDFEKLMAEVAMCAIEAVKEAARAQELAALARVYAAQISRTKEGYLGQHDAGLAVKDFAKLVGINLPE